jgi:MerR family transcriptional regulator, copper efflux regulator
MRIGELAHHTGTTPKAIRLYEARGLMGTVARAGSYRDYGDADVARVLLIRRAQVLGFRLSQLTGLPALDSPEGWEDVARLVADRRAAVAQERARLAALDAELALLEVELRSCDDAPAAPASGSALACAAPAAPPPPAAQVRSQNQRFIARA